MPQSQSKRIPQGLLDKPELGTLAPVAHPEILYQNVGYVWTKDEDDLLKEMVPDYKITFKQIQEKIPWRTLNAILLRSSRMGLKAIYPEGTW